MAKLPENNIYGNDLVYKKPEEDCIYICGHIPARLVLYMLSWSGFLVSFMMRTDINIAIVAMVTEVSPALDSNVNNTLNTTQFTVDMSEVCYVETNQPNGTLEDNSFEKGTLNWSSEVQSYVLASFYWAYIISQVIGGWATQKFGTKKVFGWAQFVTALCSLAIAISAEVSYVLVILARFTQGFASGLTWPAMYSLVGKWIPIKEKTRFMSSFQGFSIGIGLTYPLCGFIIANFGWRYVFYTTGSIGLFWCICWYLLAFDSPELHPRISLQEKEFIKQNTNVNFASNKHQKVPWSAILRSSCAWAIGITTFGRIWVHYTFIVSGPRYMQSILGYGIQGNGLLSGLPFVTSYLGSVLFCYVADLLTTKELLSLTNIRKIFTFLAQCVPGVLCILIGYLGCEVILVIIVWFFAVTLITAAYAGAMANVVDIAPNLAGPVLAFAQTIHMTASFLSPLANGYLTRNGHTLTAWRQVFFMSAVVACVTYIFYQIFGTADEQDWDDPNYDPKKSKKRSKIGENALESALEDEFLDVQAPMIEKGNNSGDSSPI